MRGGKQAACFLSYLMDEQDRGIDVTPESGKRRIGIKRGECEGVCILGKNDEVERRATSGRLQRAKGTGRKSLSKVRSVPRQAREMNF